MSDACGHGAKRPPSTTALTAALCSAEQRVVADGQRWTPSRSRVYELLLRSGRPTKAYDLMADYSEERTAKPPTVYRALEFLEEQGLVHRIASLNAFQACEGDEHAHAASFMICRCCGAADEFSPDVEVSVMQSCETVGFAPALMTLEVRGVCRRCAAS